MSMKRLIRILATLAIILPAAGCKMEAGPSDVNDSTDEYTLIVSGCVVDQENSNPLPGITVTLLSIVPSNPNNQKTATTTTGEDGCYLIRKRFNTPAYNLSHVLQCVDESDTYKESSQMAITVHANSFSLSEHGYYLSNLNFALSKK